MKDLPLKDKIEIAAEQIEQSDEVGCLTAQQLRHILTNFADSLVKNIAYEPVLAVSVCKSYGSCYRPEKMQHEKECSNHCPHYKQTDS